MTDAGFQAKALEFLERIAVALEKIAIDPLGTGAATEVEELPPTCQHPLEARIDFGGMGGHEDFECRICGYRTPEPELEPIGAEG